MSSIFTIKRNDKKIHVIRGYRAPVIQIGDQQFYEQDLNSTLAKFNDFWTLMETVHKHGYLSAAMSVIGRSAVGSWFSLRKHPEFGTNAPQLHRRRLMNFYLMPRREWDNIKDFYSLAHKLMIGVMYLRYFGQAAYHILRNEAGTPIGMDHLTGMVVPNVDSNGNFKSPAFVQYPTNNPTKRNAFNDPQDIIYMTNPDWEGSPLGGSEIEALAQYVLPIDLYLQGGARAYLENRGKPEVVYSLPPDISDEAFDAFVKEIQSRYSGPSNMGRNPIAVQGDFDIHELRDLPEKLPFNDSRREAREEELAVAGVPGGKLGITESLASANLRELRREFHETTMQPLFQVFEMFLYEQLHVRTMGTPGWEFKFDNPDFLNAVERATVHLRYRQMGAMSPNEVRFDLNLPRRTDDQGDMFADQDSGEIPNPQGNPPEGRPAEPDSPEQVGEPNDAEGNPERGDQHDETPRDSMLGELALWQSFAKKRVKGGRSIRPFQSSVIPDEVVTLVTEQLKDVNTIEGVDTIFDDVYSVVREIYDE